MSVLNCAEQTIPHEVTVVELPPLAHFSFHVFRTLRCGDWYCLCFALPLFHLAERDAMYANLYVRLSTDQKSIVQLTTQTPACFGTQSEFSANLTQPPADVATVAIPQETPYSKCPESSASQSP